MTDFIKSPDGGIAPCSEKKGSVPLLRIMNTDEFRNSEESFPRRKELLHSLGSIRYCKAEAFKNGVTGTMRIPQKSEQLTPALSFGFYMTSESLYFIEDTGDLKRRVEKQAKDVSEPLTPDGLMFHFISSMIEDDVIYLSHIESETEKLDEILGGGTDNDFFARLTKYRRKLSEFNAYYAQLANVCEIIKAHPCTEQTGSLWDGCINAVRRLQDYVILLRESVLQLRELYQAQLDARQNKIMGILTVVTTVFLPLTLLTGWYGMNFAYMPELRWRFGYITVIAVAAVIVICEIIYFKKKKFF